MKSLAAKFNLLTILLIVGTSTGISLFVVRQYVTQNYEDLENRGVTIAAMIAQNSEYAVYTEDKRSLAQMADSIQTDPDAAYIAIQNAQGQMLVSKTKDASFSIPGSLAGRRPVGDRQTTSVSFQDETTGKDYIEIRTPIITEATADALSMDLGKTSSGPSEIGSVRLGMSRQGLSVRIRRFLFSMVMFTSLIILAGIAVTLSQTKKIAAPIGRAVEVARQISSGNLTHMIEHGDTAEVAELTIAMESMSANLREMLEKITALASSVSTVASAITDSPESVLRVVDEQKQVIETTAASIKEVNVSISAISKSSENLRVTAKETSVASNELGRYVAEVADHAEVFDRMAHDVASSVEQMVVSIQKIAGAIELLASSAEQTSSALGEMESTIKDVQQNAQESVRLAEKVSVEFSDTGLRAARAAIEGTEHARESVVLLSGAVNNLQQYSERIGTIVGVINEVTDQTNLLSLNAAILAAQAGSHGTAFAVVAREIKNLAERTAASTREIGELIGSVQGEVKESVGKAEAGTRAADEAVALVRNVYSALESIHESAIISSDMSKSIQRAATEESQVVRHITETALDESHQIEQIRKSIREQAAGSESIRLSIEKVRAGSGEMKTATAELVNGSSRMRLASQNVASQVDQISAAIESQMTRSDAIVKGTIRITETTGDLIASAKEMNDMIVCLSTDARNLIQALAKFSK